MCSYFYNCSIPLIPEMEKADIIVENKDVSSVELPEIYYDRLNVPNKESPMFAWGANSLLIKKDNHVVEYDEISRFDALVRTESGDVVWENGQDLVARGFPVDEIVDFRPAKEYWIYEYDLENSLKKTYKVMPQETSEIDILDYQKLMGKWLPKEEVTCEFDGFSF